MTANGRIRRLGRTPGMAQADFAKAAYPGSGCAAGIENGRRAANNRIIRLARPASGAGGQRLKTGEGEMFRASPAEQKERIPSLFDKPNPKFQEYALAVAGRLANPQNSRKNEMFISPAPKKARL